MKHINHPATIADLMGTAVITGASSGLGQIYADRLAKRGYDLLLVARRGEKLDHIAKALHADYGIAASTLIADLATPAGVDTVAAAITGDTRITLLVNNAGTSTLALLATTTDAQIAAMNALNMDAVARLSRAVLPGFLARDKGTLINIGSVLAFFSLPASGIYSGTKGYVQNFTRALQDEVKGTKVVVQLVMPAATATDIWEISGVPLSHLDPASVMTPEHCVDAALAGLDLGEAITFPSLEDSALFAAYETARSALFAGTQSGQPATRYAKQGQRA